MIKRGSKMRRSSTRPERYTNTGWTDVYSLNTSVYPVIQSRQQQTTSTGWSDAKEEWSTGAFNSNAKNPSNQTLYASVDPTTLNPSVGLTGAVQKQSPERFTARDLGKSRRLKVQIRSKAHQNLQARTLEPCEPTHKGNRRFTPWFERNRRKTEQERGFLKTLFLRDRDSRGY